MNDNCPNCNTSWIGDSIPDGLMKTGHYKNREEAEKAATSYGWTPENNKCFRLEIGISDRIEDRIIAYECPECKFRIKN